MTPFAWTAATATAVVAGWLVSTAPRVSPPPPPPPIVEFLTPAAAAARVEREVVEPMRDRRLGIRTFSRAGPTFDEGTLRAVLETDVAPKERHFRFRVEVDRLRKPRSAVTRWLGRIDRETGAIELAPGGSDPKAEIAWKPAAAILPTTED